MKFIYIAILAGLLAGCATAPSEYNQGCRDGVSGLGAGELKGTTAKYCDDLDRAHRDQQRIRESGGRKP